MLRPCPACAVSVANVAKFPLQHVITSDGVSHLVPAIWLADRRVAFERAGLLPLAALRAAYLDWAATCALGRES